MKSFKLFQGLILPFIILISSFVANASPYTTEYQNDEAINQFFEYGTVDDFEKISPALRPAAIAAIIAMPEVDPNDRDPWILPEQDEVLKKYFETVSNEEKKQIYMYAFVLSVGNHQTVLANKFFDLATGSDSMLAKKSICEAFKDQVESSPCQFQRTMKENADTFKQLIPLIAKNNLAYESCQVGNRTFTIGQLMAYASPELGQGLSKQISLAYATNAAVVTAYAQCSEVQIKDTMFHSMAPLKTASAGNSIYISTGSKESGCVIDGLLYKKIKGQDLALSVRRKGRRFKLMTTAKPEIEYVFYPSNKIVGYMKTGFTFQTLDEIVKFLKVNPTIYLTSSKATPIASVRPIEVVDRIADKCDELPKPSSQQTSVQLSSQEKTLPREEPITSGTIIKQMSEMVKSFLGR